MFDFDVDVVPAVHWGDHYAIPEVDPDSWASDDIADRWRRTDPLLLTT